MVELNKFDLSYFWCRERYLLMRNNSARDSEETCKCALDPVIFPKTKYFLEGQF